MPPTDPVLGVVERRLALAEEHLAAAAGDRSLCDLSRAGAPGGVKELEGRTSALLEVRRELRRAPRSEPTEVTDAVAARWRAELGRDRSRGPVWERYRSGGLDELDALRVEVAALS